VYGWGEEASKRMLDTCRPLGVEVYKIKDEEEVLRRWEESKSPAYKNYHGLKTPVFGE